jgi:hypothetical protein
MLTITHTHADGTLIDGTSRGDSAIPLLKANGWRWMPSISKWGLRGSRDHMARLYVIENTATALRKAGLEVAVEIDETARPADERHSDEADRLADRRDALEAKADRRRQEGDLAHDKAKQIMDTIPLGQPILVGHHSERRMRKDIDRIQSGIGRAVESWRAADAATAAAAASRRHESFRESGPATERRIDRLETEVRLIDRRLATANRNPTSGGTTPDQLREWEARLNARREYLQGELTYWRAHLASLIADGTYSPATPSAYHRGDQVHTTWGEATVVRASAKSITVTMPPPQVAGERRIRYADVKGLVSRVGR